MTTPVEKTQAVEATPAKQAKAPKAKTRKPAVKRDYNALGKFFAKIRIDVGLGTPEWCKELEVSSLTVTNMERGDSPMTYDFAVRASKLIEAKAPQYSTEFASIVAQQLGVLLIPTKASDEAIEQAYLTLVHFDSHKLADQSA